jgi:hypothetical protein
MRKDSHSGIGKALTLAAVGLAAWGLNKLSDKVSQRPSHGNSEKYRYDPDGQKYEYDPDDQKYEDNENYIREQFGGIPR